MTAHTVWDWEADCSRLVVLWWQMSCLQNCCATDWRVLECWQNTVVWYGRGRRADSRWPGNPGRCRTRTGGWELGDSCQLSCEFSLADPLLWQHVSTRVGLLSYKVFLQGLSINRTTASFTLVQNLYKNSKKGTYQILNVICRNIAGGEV